MALSVLSDAQCELESLTSTPLSDPTAAFGLSVAIDGDTLVAGAPLEEGRLGSAYVFERSGGHWFESAHLTPADLPDARQFGYSVAIQGDRVLVGAYQASEGGHILSGAAYLFERGTSGWAQVAKLVSSQPADAGLFGIAVALQGERAFVGALETTTLPSDGAVYVFERQGTTWTEKQRLTAAVPEEQDWFGISLAVSGDTLLVGASGYEADALVLGSARVFDRLAGGWTETARIIGPAQPGGLDHFGRSVALDGGRALIGAYGPDLAGQGGGAFLYERGPAGWSLVQELLPHEVGPNDHLGKAVALRGDRALVGAPLHGEPELDAGTAWLFTRGVSKWEERGKLSDSSPIQRGFCGQAVALASDGTAVIGASDAHQHGAVKVWSTSPGGCATLASTPASISLSQGGTQALHLRVPPDAAGDFYLVLGSENGTSPGLSLPGGLHLSLNPGSMLGYTLRFHNVPPLANTLGRFDANGEAVASIAIPAGSAASLIGLRLNFAFLSGRVSGSSSTLRGASNSAVLELVP